MKKFLAMLMAIVMVVGMVPTALAVGSGAINVSVKNAYDGSGVAGAGIRLEYVSAGKYHDHGVRTTGSDGSVKFSGLSDGVYRVTQDKTPDGYAENTDIVTVTIKNGSVETCTMKNTPLRSISITRITPDGPVGGGVYEVRNHLNSLIGQYTTNSDGTVIVPGLEPGWYSVSEVTPPAGAVQDGEVRRVEVLPTSKLPVPVVFKASDLGSITVSLTNEIVGPVVGVRFELTDARGDFVASAVTNNAGLAVFTNLQPGAYQVAQTNVLSGYVDTMKTQRVTLADVNDQMHQTVTLTNDLLGSIRISCDGNDGSALPGVTYSIYIGTNLVRGGLVSDESGIVLVSGLEAATYHVVAVAPDGYVMDKDAQEAVVEVNKTIDVDFHATGKGNLAITAVDEFGSPLAGVTFKVSKMSGELLGYYHTSSSGLITIPRLDPDTYVIEESGVPSGYVLETSSYKVFVTAGETNHPKFVIRSRPFIVVETFIQDTSTAIPGAVYEIYDSNGAKAGTGVSDNEGKVRFYDLAPGVYSIKNISVPDGYQIITAAQTATITDDKSDTKTFYAVRQSSLVIRSFDVNGKPLADTQFVIRNSQGLIIEALTTDASGTAVSQSHNPGEYYVEMTYAPDGYVPAITQQKTTIVNLKDTYVDFTCGKKSSIVVHAYDMAGEKVVGAEFAIIDGITGVEVQHVTTSETGVVVSKELTPGIYLVRGTTTPKGYAGSVNITIPVVVYADKAVPVRFTFRHLGSIQMSSVDNTTNQVLTEGVYTVEDAVTGIVVGRYAVDETGYVTTPGLPNGQYVVKQVIAQDGYKLQQVSQRVTITGDKAQTCVFRNEKLSGLIIESVVQGTHNRLAGGSFEVYDPQQKQIFCGPADANGNINLPDIAPGTYFVKHLVAADGYRVVDSERKAVVTVNGPTTVVFENVALTSLTVAIMDQDTKEALEGVRFKVQSIGGKYIAEVVTDKTGSVTINDLPVGKYLVSQIAPVGDYQLEPDYQWAEVKINENARVVFTNVRHSGLVIRALELGTDLGLVGAKFQVWEQNGKLIGEYTTNADGTIDVGLLLPGKYLIKETAAPGTYTIITATQTVEITDSLNTTAVFYHQPYGNVTVKAVNARTNVGIAGAVFNVYTHTNEYIGQYTTSNNGCFTLPRLAPGNYILECIKAPDGYILDKTPKTFKLSEDSNQLIEVPLETTSDFKIIVTAKQDGRPVPGVQLKVTTLEGRLIGNYVSDEDGVVSLIVLPGEYLVYETYGPDNVVLDKNPHNIKIDPTTQNTMELQVVRLSTIRVRFVDAETKEPIYNVRFELKDKANNWIGIYNSDNDGYVYLTDVLHDGLYVLTMLECPSNYIKDNVPKTVEITTAEDTSVIWELNAQKGQVIITTRSSTDNAYRNLKAGSLLPEAVYTIWDENGNVVNKIYGDKYGEAFSGALPIGTYYIRQTTAPCYYLINEQKVTVNITDKNQKVNVNVYNKSADVGSTVDVEGPKTAYSGQEIKYFFADVRNTSKTQVSQFLFHIKLPHDAVRAGTLNTGTWTGTNRNYSISYKTNKADYKVLATGLATGSNYSFDMSSTALGLAQDEYVTDIRFEFKDAVGGFHCEMAPTLYAYLLPTLPVGYQVICKTEAALLYNDNWSKAADSWTTTVTGSHYTPLPTTPGVPQVVVPNLNWGGKVIVIPATLPKTGY